MMFLNSFNKLCPIRRASLSIFSLFYVLTLNVSLTQSAKVNTPRVLLPWLEHTVVNFTFEVTEGGCYLWSCSREDAVGLSPYDGDGCSRSARVWPVRTAPASAIILAEDTITGEVLRGDVDIGHIDIIKIDSTTRDLYLEQAPEAFKVHAYDEKGNRFSSLEGVEFTWTVTDESSKQEDDSVIRLIWWQDSTYEAPPGMVELESTGLRGNTVLLQGVSIGNARVTAKISSKDYSSLPAASIDLRVRANVLLRPARSILSAGDELTYTVVRTRAGRMEKITLQHSDYSLAVEDANTAVLMSDGVTVRGIHEGVTSVHLMSSGGADVTSVWLGVARVHSLRVLIKPYSLVLPGKLFNVQVSLYTREGELMTAGTAVLVRLSVEGVAHVELLSNTDNGTYATAQARHIGTATITAHLHSIAGRTVTPKVSGSAKLNVVPNLEVHPPVLLLPWLESQPPFEYQLSCSGGDGGECGWRVVGGGSVSVSSSGRVLALSPGRATARATLLKHTHITADASVRVSEPIRLAVVMGGGPVRVGSTHVLHVALYSLDSESGREVALHACDCAFVAATVLDGTPFVRVPIEEHFKLESEACCAVGGVWREAGDTLIRLSLSGLSAAVRVSARDAPAVRWPTRSIALPVGASVNVLASGGGPDDTLLTTSSRPSIVSVRTTDDAPPHSMPTLTVLTAKCHKEGISTVNVGLSTNDHNEEGANLEINCVPTPTTVTLLAPPRPESCTMLPHVEVWLSRGGPGVEIRVECADAAGRPLVILDGAGLHWQSSPAKAVQVEIRDAAIRHDPQYAPTHVPLQHYQILTADANNKAVEAEIVVWAGSARATLNVAIVDSLRTDRDQVSVYVNEANETLVALVSGGSGTITASWVGGEGVSVRCHGDRVTVQARAVGQGVIVLTDACLPHAKLEINLSIVDTVSVELTAPSALEVGGCLPCSVSLRDSRGRPVVYTAPLAIGLRPLSEHTRASNKADTWEICGEKSGTATVRATLSGVVAGVVWADAKVVVFGKLSMEPKVWSAPPGVKIQLRVVGGPPSAVAELRYRVGDGDTKNPVVETFGSTGLVHTLRPGRATVTVQAVDRQTHQLYSEDSVEINVVMLSGVRAVAATNTLLLEHTAPIWLSGVPVELGSAELGSLEPGLTVQWTLSDSSAASLTTPITDSDVEDSACVGCVSVRITVHHAGPVLVKANVQYTNHKGKKESWETSVEVTGVAPLSLVGVEGSAGHILLSPGSTFTLRPSIPAGTRLLPEDTSVVRVDRDGVLKAVRAGVAALQVSTANTNGDFEQTLLVHVEVRPVHYIMLMARESWEGSLPAGAALLLYASARDAVGRPFTVNPAMQAVDARVHRNDRAAVSMQGKNVNVELLVEGPSMLSLESGRLADHVLLQAEPAMYPHQIIACEGWLVCAGEGVWTESDERVIWVHPGVALVREHKAVPLWLHTTGPPRRRLRLSTVPLQNFALDVKGALAVTPDAPLLIPVKMEPAVNVSSTGHMVCSDEDRVALAHSGALTRLAEYPIECSVLSEQGSDAPRVSAVPQLDPYTGLFGCEIRVWDAPTWWEGPSAVVVTASRGTRSAETLVLVTRPLHYSAERFVLTARKQSDYIVVTGHPTLIKSLEVTVTPGLESAIEVNPYESEAAIRVWLSDGACSAPASGGWLSVRALAQGDLATRVPVDTSGAGCQDGYSPLANLFQATYGPLSIVFTALAMLFGLLYVYKNYFLEYLNKLRLQENCLTAEQVKAQLSALHAATPLPHRASPLTRTGPVYGDASLSPETSPARAPRPSHSPRNIFL